MAKGVILGQTPNASNITYNNNQTSSIITGNNVQQAIDQLFTSVSNGKSKIAGAITDKGVSTSPSDSFDIMAQNIGKIPVGYFPEDIDVKFIPATFQKGSASHEVDCFIETKYIESFRFYIFLLTYKINTVVNYVNTLYFAATSRPGNWILPTKSYVSIGRDNHFNAGNSKSGEGVIEQSIIDDKTKLVVSTGTSSTITETYGFCLSCAYK